MNYDPTPYNLKGILILWNQYLLKETWVKGNQQKGNNHHSSVMLMLWFIGYYPDTKRERERERDCMVYILLPHFGLPVWQSRSHRSGESRRPREALACGQVWQVISYMHQLLRSLSTTQLSRHTNKLNRPEIFISYGTLPTSRQAT